jgi:hypothetical protein
MKIASALFAVSGILLALSAGTSASAETGGWTEDPITGCSVWSAEDPQPDEGVSWSGDCIEGKASGEGSLVWWDRDGLKGRYLGGMSNGKVDGEGRLIVRDDEAGGFHEYLGRFADGNPTGAGFLRKSDGTRFVGELVDGLHHVKGLVLTPKGWLIRGEFTDGEAAGPLLVDYTTEDGERYFGQAENGKRNGFGILTASDNDFYAGGFAEGLPDGPGIYKGVGGDRYTGDFAAGRPNGFGTSIDAKGNVIQGRFVNGEPDGTILVTEPDGTQSITEWQAGSAQ